MKRYIKSWALVQGTESEATVAHKRNQGTIRHRDVIDGGALFCLLFWASKKVRKKRAAAFNSLALS